MNEIARRGEIVLHAVEQPERELHIRRRGTPEQLLETILGHRNWIASYRPVPGCAQPRLAEVWVLGPSETPAPQNIAELTPAAPPAPSPTSEQINDNRNERRRPAEATETPRGRGRMSPAERIQEREQRRLAEQRARDGKQRVSGQ